MKRKYDASSISVVTNDRDRVRKRPTLYIPSTGVEGALHAMFEIVDNSIDELTARGSVGDTVTLMYDTETKVVTVTDNGSGIPQEKLLEVCTIINSSGKFNNGEDSAYQYSGGINGIGLKIGVFLSEWCSVTSMRDKKSLTYNFVNGELHDQASTTTKEHGTVVKFKLGQRWVDINGVTKNDLINRYEEKSYLFPNVKLNLVITKDGKTVTTKTFGGKDIIDRVKMMKPDTEVIHASGIQKISILQRIKDDGLAEKTVIVDVAFGMSEKLLDMNEAERVGHLISYGNTIKTYMGGAHVDGLKDGFVKFFKEKVNLGQRDKNLQIMPSDITAGLCAFVIAKVYEPEFRGQHKDQLGNTEARYAVRNVVFDKLCELKPSVVNTFVDFVKRVARGREASKKTRKRDVSNAFSKDRIDKFTDYISSMETVCPELVLVEGKSAGGNAFSARDPYNQAIYYVQKPKNVYDDSSDTINMAKEGAVSAFNDILNICGIRAGKKCDPDASRIKFINMLTDADVDGDHIAITVISLLAKHCKPLIDAGMVGRILPPAYSFPDPNNKKRRIYVRSQREFFDNIMKSFSKEMTVGRGKVDYKRGELFTFLSNNFYYADRLDKLADRYCCDAKLLEYIAAKYHGGVKDQKQTYWSNALKKYQDLRVIKEGSDLVIDGTTGPNASDYVNLIFDEDFNRRMHKFKENQLVNDHITGYTLNHVEGKTVYDIMKMFIKYRPKDVKRFKGLGELSPEELSTLCMDPKSRAVAVFKFNDIDTDMNKISVIMSTRKEYAMARSDIMMNIVADDMDIDT